MEIHGSYMTKLAHFTHGDLERGYLSWVDVTYGASNFGPVPEGLVVGATIGAWPAVREWGIRGLV